MKKIITSLLITLSLTVSASADQLAYITRNQAEKAAAFIKTQREVLLFCGCCENDPAIYLKVADAVVKHTGYENYYQVIITGISRDGEKMTVEADLAYVHVNKGGRAVAVGKILNFECDPCVTELRWKGTVK